MKSILRTAAAGVAIASLGIASAASAATETADAEATILAALTVTLDATNTDLQFGDIAESGNGGTVTLTSGNVRSCSVDLLCSGTTMVPEFDLTGVANAPVSIGFTANTIQLLGAGAPMNVDLSSSSDTLVLSGTGTGSFTVGGQLAVAAGQTPGVYTGTLEVEVLYN